MTQLESSEFQGHSLIFENDNMGLVWSFRKGRSKRCPYVTMIIQALNYVAVHFSVNLIVRHRKRKTTPDSVLADTLTRQDDASKLALSLLQPKNFEENSGDLKPIAKIKLH